METTVIKKSTEGLLALYDIHTKLFKNVLDGISAEDAVNRLNTKANHIAWLAGGLVFQRYECSNLLGVEQTEKPAGYELFKDWKGLQEGATYPTLEEYKKDWDRITPLLKAAMENVSDERLDSISPVKMGTDVTYREVLTWNAHREAYLVGQIGLWRRIFGYDAMKY